MKKKILFTLKGIQFCCILLMAFLYLYRMVVPFDRNEMTVPLQDINQLICFESKIFCMNENMDAILIYDEEGTKQNTILLKTSSHGISNMYQYDHKLYVVDKEENLYQYKNGQLIQEHNWPKQLYEESMEEEVKNKSDYIKDTRYFIKGIKPKLMKEKQGETVKIAEDSWKYWILYSFECMKKLFLILFASVILYAAIYYILGNMQGKKE